MGNREAELTHLDLFSGIGGFALAAGWAGFRTVAFVEIEPYAQRVLRERFGAVLADGECEPKHIGVTGGDEAGSGSSSPAGPMDSWDRHSRPALHPDIFTLSGADYAGVDLVTAGFPCQPFSVAGMRRGKEDDRHLWPEVVRVLREMAAAGGLPAWFLGENVPGIIPMELDRCLADLEALGYACWTFVIPACAVDARHRRDRVWIVATVGDSRSASENIYSKRNDIGRALSACEPSSSGAEDVAHAEHLGRGIPKIPGSPESRNGTPAREGGTEQPARPDRGEGRYSDVADGICGVVRGADGACWGGGEQAETISDAWGGGGQEDGMQFPQPSMGGMADGLPCRVDADHCSWPDDPHPEVPRTATGVRDRVGRLKGLGNAIVPQVAYEILRNISLIEGIA